MNGLFGTGCLLLGVAVYFFLKYLEVKKDLKENKVKDKGKAKSSATFYVFLTTAAIVVGLFAMVNGVLLGVY